MFDAILTNAEKEYSPTDPTIFRVKGNIFYDKKGRFVDGQYVYTSRVMSIEDNIVTTLNSTYSVQHWKGSEG